MTKGQFIVFRGWAFIWWLRDASRRNLGLIFMIVCLFLYRSKSLFPQSMEQL